MKKLIKIGILQKGFSDNKLRYFLMIENKKIIPIIRVVIFLFPTRGSNSITLTIWWIKDGIFFYS